MKFLFALLAVTLLFSSSSFAKQPEHAKNKKMKKMKKSKSLPYGLQKKLNRGGELPPGWKNKLVVGEVLPYDILSRGVVINPRELGIRNPDSTYSKIYKIHDIAVRVNKVTGVILEVLK